MEHYEGEVCKLSVEASVVVCTLRRGGGLESSIAAPVGVSRMSRRADVRTGRDEVVATAQTG
jgi:hypothetical protein